MTGLDILPVLVKALLRMPTDGDMEWWSAAQVSSWMDSLLWVPHHVAGLVCCLLGFLLVWMSKGLSRGGRAGCGLIAGLSFASAFGLSTWVAVAFAMMMAAWMVWAIVWERGLRSRVPFLLLAGVVASAALLPYLAELHGEASATNAVLANGAASSDGKASIANDGTHLLRFGVRHIIPADSVQGIGWVARLAEAHPAAEDAGVGLVLLLPGYFVELGFYGLVLLAALWAMRRRRLDEAARTALLLAVAGLAVSTFLRSTIVENNDFAMRSILIAQFFLLLLAVVWWEGGLGDDQTIPARRDACDGLDRAGRIGLSGGHAAHLSAAGGGAGATGGEWAGGARDGVAARLRCDAPARRPERCGAVQHRAARRVLLSGGR